MKREDKKLIMGCITQQLVSLVFGTHYYMWDGTIYKQTEGCPMGVDGSSPIARVVMDEWVRLVRETEEKSKILNTLNPTVYEPLETYLLSK